MRLWEQREHLSSASLFFCHCKNVPGLGGWDSFELEVDSTGKNLLRSWSSSSHVSLMSSRIKSKRRSAVEGNGSPSESTSGSAMVRGIYGLHKSILLPTLCNCIGAGP